MAIMGGKIIYKQHKKIAWERRNTPKLRQTEIIQPPVARVSATYASTFNSHVNCCPRCELIGFGGQDIVIEVECRVRALIHQTTRQVPITQTAFSSLKIGPSHHANVATDASASVDRSGQ